MKKIAFICLLVHGCYLSHERLDRLEDASTEQDADVCPRVIGQDAGVFCTFENRYDIRPDFAAAAERLGCPRPNPVCHYSCDDQKARAAFACANSCPDLYWQDRQLCGP